ncbi:FAD-dependent oxidoreductase [Candidatus Cyrtobacter comes]|nr:FAD-dependent oxidoreductase [Candidatus Cyrtobacter comes]
MQFSDLYTEAGIKKLDHIFLNELSLSEVSLYKKLIEYRNTDSYNPELTIDVAYFAENFIASFFGIEFEVKGRAGYYEKIEPVISCNRNFIQKKVVRSDMLSEQEICSNIDKAKQYLLSIGLGLQCEIELATQINNFMKDGNEEGLYHAKIYSCWIMGNKDAPQSNWTLFKVPAKKDYDKLIKIKKDENLITYDHYDKNKNEVTSLWNLKYCLYCHKRGKDSCSNGLRNNITYIKNPLDIELSGCPLDEKISEMNFVKSQGFIIAPLIIVTIDNPMVAATGHRICNECSRACIYQKQEAVDIPMVESQILNDVLNLPWGFEIYSLLTRWNPLKNNDYMPYVNIGKRVLVAGLGPAGFTLSHYLLNSGVNVVAIDGLKIEQMPSDISGIDEFGKRHIFKPIYNISEVYGEGAQGFGGVAEYGITQRWDKNYLRIIRLLLERRFNFRMYGGVQLGGNIKNDDLKTMNFSHVSLCLGAGSPNIPKIRNIFAKGVHCASDFLMQLHLDDALRKNSNTNLQIELPLIVIGAGLTAIDTAVEAFFYYAVQVEEFLSKSELLGDQFLDSLSEDDAKRAERFIKHAKLLRGTKNKREKISMLKSFGGAFVVYRSHFEKSPSYRTNYEELEDGLKEGIGFLENIEPIEIELDESGRCTGLRHKDGVIKAKTILIAAGTNPNSLIAKELDLELDGKFIKKKSGVLAKHGVSYFGDMHADYSGSVVRAIASAKYGHKYVINDIKESEYIAQHSFSDVDDALLSKIIRVSLIAKNTIEIIVRSKLAAKNFKPGQFYKFEAYKKNKKEFFMEGLALTGAEISGDLISLIVLETGASSSMCRSLKNGDAISLMGPTGEPTEILSNKTVMLVGGGLGNAVLFSIGKALRQNGCMVLYFAGYKAKDFLFKRDKIEDSSDIVVWCCDDDVLEIRRKQDLFFKMNIVEAIKKYNSVKDVPIPLQEVDRIISIGSDAMMQAVTFARYNQLSSSFKKECDVIVSINSPMQCMMKGICSRCVQKYKNNITGEEGYFYSCLAQDQNARYVDFEFLNRRLGQNSLLEKACFQFFKRIM